MNFAEQLTTSQRVLILDHAPWHKVQRLNWHRRYLPAYRPDFNPIERLWLPLEAEGFADFLAKTPQTLYKRSIEALHVFSMTRNRRRPGRFSERTFDKR
jgi:transposase